MAHFGPILDPLLDPYLGHLEVYGSMFWTRFWGVTGWRRRATISCCCVLGSVHLDPFGVGTPGPCRVPVQGSIPEHPLKGLFGHLHFYCRLSSQMASRMGSQMGPLLEGPEPQMAQNGPIWGLGRTPVVMGFSLVEVPNPNVRVCKLGYLQYRHIPEYADLGVQTPKWPLNGSSENPPFCPFWDIYSICPLTPQEVSRGCLGMVPGRTPFWALFGPIWGPGYPCFEGSQKQVGHFHQF